MTKEQIIGTREQRLARIGGSEFATVLGINPYKKRIELVLEKAGVIANTFIGNEATRRGENLENDVIALFEDETGLTVTDEQKEYSVTPELCLPLVCHVDGLTSDGGIFEAKTTDINAKTWKNNEIPDYYKAQLDFNLNLSGRSIAYIAVGFCKGNEIVDFKYFVHQVDRTLKEIVDTCQQFTEDVEAYKCVGVVNNGKIIKDNSKQLKCIEELENINSILVNLKKEFEAVIKPYEEKKKQIEEQLKEIIGENYGIENDLYRITLGNRITSPTYEYKVSRSGLKIEYK